MYSWKKLQESVISIYDSYCKSLKKTIRKISGKTNNKISRIFIIKYGVFFYSVCGTSKIYRTIHRMFKVNGYKLKQPYAFTGMTSPLYMIYVSYNMLCMIYNTCLTKDVRIFWVLQDIYLGGASNESWASCCCYPIAAFITSKWSEWSSY